jgi:hypothetical protein
MYVPAVSQWAEMIMIAWGRGKLFPHCARLLVKLLFRMIFIGDPWPINKSGIFFTIDYSSFVSGS